MQRLGGAGPHELAGAASTNLCTSPTAAAGLGHPFETLHLASLSHLQEQAMSSTRSDDFSLQSLLNTTLDMGPVSLGVH